MLQIPVSWTRIMTVPPVELPRPFAADMMQQPFQPTVERGSIQEKYRIFMGYVCVFFLKKTWEQHLTPLIDHNFPKQIVIWGTHHFQTHPFPGDSGINIQGES
jgi:hypothetical protein